jgi:hypothetical protein
MGVDIPFFKADNSLLHNRDIAKNQHIGPDMRGDCTIEDQCLRKFLLDYLQCGELLWVRLPKSEQEEKRILE